MGVSARTRHYEAWQQFLRDAFNLRHISIHLTDTDSEVADIFTKAKMKVVANYKAFRAYLFNMH